MYKAVSFSGGGAMHPFSGTHYSNQSDHNDQFTVTLYPHGEASPDPEMKRPHITVARLVSYGSNEWKVLSVTPLDKS
jgi:hypothetical protein